MPSSRPVFRSRWLPYLLVAPQLIITVIFFIWPAGEALWYSALTDGDKTPRTRGAVFRRQMPDKVRRLRRADAWFPSPL